MRIVRSLKAVRILLPGLVDGRIMETREDRSRNQISVFGREGRMPGYPKRTRKIRRK
jgi:hypothetical protein